MPLIVDWKAVLINWNSDWLQESLSWYHEISSIGANIMKFSITRSIGGKSFLFFITYQWVTLMKGQILSIAMLFLCFF